jgi:hypothetical protein
MFPTKTVLTIVTFVTLPWSAAAQFTTRVPPPTLTLTRVLPPAESRFGSYDLAIGDSIVGGSVHAFTGMVRQKQGTYELADLAIELSATGKFLGRSAEIVDISGFGNNVMNNGVQTRSGQIRYEVLGSTVQRSFQGSFTLPPDTAVFSLFPADVSGSVTLFGGYRANLTGNATCGFGIDASWTLPDGKADVGLVSNGDAFAIVSAVGQLQMGSQSGPVTITGKIVNNQKLSVNATTSAASGLSGGATYTMNQASAVMVVFTLTNQALLWSNPSVNKKLM